MTSALPDKKADVRTLPKRISPCPIKEAVLEIRFESTLPPDAISGMAYDRLKASFPKMDKLPILQLPSQLLSADPELKFKPHYRLSGDSAAVSVNMGPTVISFVMTEPYPGWTEFSGQYKKILSQIIEANFISRVTRVGIRYVNFFETDVFNLVTLSTSLGDQRLISNDMTVRIMIAQGNFKNTLTISNNVKVKSGKEPLKSGSILDIDSFTDTPTDVRTVIARLLDEGC
jgi:uncharacterized protein (TIGR04255 family)